MTVSIEEILLYPTKTFLFSSQPKLRSEECTIKWGDFQMTLLEEDYFFASQILTDLIEGNELSVELHIAKAYISLCDSEITDLSKGYVSAACALGEDIERKQDRTTFGEVCYLLGTSFILRPDLRNDCKVPAYIRAIDPIRLLIESTKICQLDETTRPTAPERYMAIGYALMEKGMIAKAKYSFEEAVGALIELERTNEREIEEIGPTLIAISCDASKYLGDALLFERVLHQRRGQNRRYGVS